MSAANVKTTFSTNFTFLFKVLTRDQFEEIVSFLHLSDNQLQPKKGEPGYDKLYKIRPLLDLLNTNFKANPDMEEVTSVDEQMIPFRGPSFSRINHQKGGSRYGSCLIETVLKYLPTHIPI